jgi:hypothetical protein
LDPIERQGLLDLLHTRFIDQAPAQVHATLLDEGTYLCSPRTMYRVLDDAHDAWIRNRASCGGRMKKRAVLKVAPIPSGAARDVRITM